MDVEPSGDAPQPPYEQLAAGEVLRRLPVARIDPPTPAPALLPLTLLEPEAFERLSAEIVYRAVDGSVQFYGRRGQKQFGLDVVAHPAGGRRTVYQVRRYQTMSAAELRAAVAAFAGPPRPANHPGPPRPFDPGRFVVMTSAATENDTALVSLLAELRNSYADDLEIDLWGAEALGRRLRDAAHTVAAVFGSVWAIAWCGPFVPVAPQHPSGLGLVEDPVEVLNLDGLRDDAAAAQQAGRHDDSAALRRSLAQALGDAGFSESARVQRWLQAKMLADARRPNDAADVLTSIAVADTMRAEEYRWTSEKHLLDEINDQLSPTMVAKIGLLDLITCWYEEGPKISAAVERLRMLLDGDDPHAAALCCQVMELCLLDGLFDYDPPRSLLLELDPRAADELDAVRQLAQSVETSDRHVRARLRCVMADSRLTLASGPDEVDAAYRDLVDDASAGRLHDAGGLVLSRAAYAYSARGAQERAVNLWRHAVLRSSETRTYGDVRSQLLSIQEAPLEEGLWDRPGAPAVGALPNDEHALGLPADTRLSAVLALQRGKFVEAFADVRKQIWHARVSGHLVEEKIALRLFADLQRDAGNTATAVEYLALAGEGKLAAELAAGCAHIVDCSLMLRSGLMSRRAAAAAVIGVQAQLYADEQLDEVVGELVHAAASLWSAPGQFDPVPELEAVRALSSFGRRLPIGAVDPILAIAAPFVQGGNRRYGQDIVLLLGNLHVAVPARRADLDAVLLQVLNQVDPPKEIWKVLAVVYPDATGDLVAAVEQLARKGSMAAFLILVQHGALPESMQHVVRAGAAAILHRPLRGDRTEQMIVQANYGTTIASCLVALINADTIVDVPSETFTAERAQLLGATGFSYGPIFEGQKDPSPVSPPPLSPETAALAAGEPRAFAAAVCCKLLAMAEDTEDLAVNRIDSTQAVARLIDHVDGDSALDIARRLIALHADPHFADHDLDEINTPTLSRFQFRTFAHTLPAHALASAAAAVRTVVRTADDDPGADANVRAHAADATARELAQAVTVRAIRLLREDDDQLNRLGGFTLQRVAEAFPELVPQFAIALISHQDDRVRAMGVTVLDQSSLDLLQDLAHDDSAAVRSAVARRITDLPEDLQAELVTDPAAQVRRAAAQAMAPGATTVT